MGTIGDALSCVKRRLSPVGQATGFEARQLMCKALSLDMAGLLARLGEPMPDDTCIELLLEKRLSGVPLQYILGEWEFMGLPFDICEGLLIPRPETELLAETALKLAQSKGYTDALDMCCGAGCIGVALAKLGGIKVTLSDISPKAIEYSKRNASKNGVEATVIQGDLFDNIRASYDLIACNPPYIPTRELSGLQAEVRREPKLALDGGSDGLDFYRRIAKAAPKHIRPGGTLLLEVGYGQAGSVIELLGRGHALNDISGIPRVVMAQY